MLFTIRNIIVPVLVLLGIFTLTNRDASINQRCFDASFMYICVPDWLWFCLFIWPCAGARMLFVVVHQHFPSMWNVFVFNIDAYDLVCSQLNSWKLILLPLIFFFLADKRHLFWQILWAINRSGFLGTTIFSVFFNDFW